ncbi:MAG: hypothetical protein HRU50_04750 [Winogradskyella sp.]|uniref:hypothetical protein n=1 Tax=Winogradskyella sp. TaxID=1883156 RepID=UPI0025DC805C|nr:hypothetical protein [Winogradskyella sp.]NRB59235.1 hypothetical protein [Winogradskyella sp.]
MPLSKIVKILIILLSVSFVTLQWMGLEKISLLAGSASLVFFLVYYLIWGNTKATNFVLFILFFTLGFLVSSIDFFIEDINQSTLNTLYFSGNILYISAYTFLIMKIIQGLNLKKVLLKSPFVSIVLLVLDVFFVILVTEVTLSELPKDEYQIFSQLVEYFYTGIIMLVLSMALINYLHRYDNKSMLILIGSICIVFSEIMQLTYFYVLEEPFINFIYGFFIVLAFVFLYKQSKLKFTGPEPEPEYF